MKFFAKNKFLKITSIVLILLAGGVYFSFDFFLERILVRDLSALINQNPDNLYFYTFDNLDLMLVEGSVSVKNIGVHPKQSSFDSLKMMDNNVYMLVEMKIEEVELVGLEIKKFIRTGELEMGLLQIVAPEFKYYFNSEKKKVRKGSTTVGNIFSDKFISAKLMELNLNQGSLEIREVNEFQPNIRIDGIDLRLEGAYADSQTIKQFGLFEYRDIFLAANGISMIVSEDFTIVSKRLFMDVRNRSLKITDFQVQPRLNRESFAAKFEFQKNWIALTIDTIKLNGIGINRFVNHDGINIENIVVMKPNLALFKDKTKELPPFKKKSMPASSIKKIPWAINIDSIVVTDGLITINEKSRITEGTSELIFSSLNATVKGFTNIDSLAGMFEVQATCRPMNASNVETKMRFNLKSLTDEFTVQGRLDQADATIFNRMLAPGLGVKILEGDIHSLSFDFAGMDTLSTGTLDFKYENLKLQILNADTTKKEKRGFLTFAANAILREKNTDDNYTKGIIYTSRDQSKGFFPFFWHNIQSGLISTLVPITNNMQKKRQKRDAKN